MMALLMVGMTMGADPATEAKAAANARDLPRVIVELRKGLLENPEDRHLAAMLETARDAVEYPPGESLRPAGPPTWARWVGPEERFAASVVLLLAMGLFAGFYFTTRARFALPIGVFATMGVIALFSYELWPVSRQNETAVVARGTTLRKGNADSYLPVLPVNLPVGTEVKVRASRGGWVQVELASGIFGWVKESDVMKIESRE